MHIQNIDLNSELFTPLKIKIQRWEVQLSGQEIDGCLLSNSNVILDSITLNIEDTRYNAHQ